MPITPELEFLEGIIKSWVLILCIFVIAAAGYFVGQTNANNYWLSKGDYTCELIKK